MTYKSIIIKACLFALVLIRIDVVFAQAPSFTYSSGAYNYTTGTPITPMVPNNIGGTVPAEVYGQTSTFAGNGTVGFADGIGTAASLSGPVGIAFDKNGNMFITDYFLISIPYINDFIREITPAGVITTLAGNVNQGYTDGQGNTAQFFSPNGVAVDAAGNVYVADVGNNVIRKITPGGLVSTFAGSGTAGSTDAMGTLASFNHPTGIAISGAGTLYVADYSNNSIRVISPAGMVSTLAGGGLGGFTNGTGNNASFKNPEGVAVDISGNVYVADAGNNAIRMITPVGVVTTFAGNGNFGLTDGPVATANFTRPTGVAVNFGGDVYVADASNNLIRKISGGQVYTLAGSGQIGNTDGIGVAASFHDPEGLGVDQLGNVFVGDKGNNVVREITTGGYAISPALPAGLNFDGTSGIITGTPISPSPTTTYTVTAYNSFGSSTATFTITVTGQIIVQTSPPAISYATPQVYKVNLTITPLAPTNSGGAVPAATYGGVTIFAGSGMPGATNNTGLLATFNSPDGVGVDAAGNVYIADGGNNVIRKITPAGVVSTLAGNGKVGSTNGLAASASFNHPVAVAVDAAGNVYVADAGNNLIRKITPGGQVSTFAIGFNNPSGLAVDGLGNVYVADTGNNLIKMITPGGVVSVFAGSGSIGSVNGTGTTASFNLPTGIAIDAAGYLYITDEGSDLIRKITPGGLVSVLAGSGSPGSVDGTGAAASFNSPVGITVDGIGNVYVGDSGNDVIRKITPGGLVTTLAGSAGNQGRGNGQGAAATFNDPRGVAIDANGNIYVGDLVNNIIREVSTNGYVISPSLPPGLNFDTTTGIISGTPTAASPATNYTITAYNIGGGSSAIVKISVQIPVITLIPPPAISYVSPQNYVVNTVVIPLAPANTGGAVPQTIYGQVATFAGSGSQGSANGIGASASFSSLHAVATDLVGNIYLTDNNLIRKITPSGAVSTLAGGSAAGSADGQGAAASFNQPMGITVDATGTVYVADTKNNTIRMITQAGVVTTIAGSPGISGLIDGTGATARFKSPLGIAADLNGNVYVSDAGNNIIRKITSSGIVSTFAGSGSIGSANGSGAAASFNNPVSLSVDQNNNIYVADAGNNLIREITPLGVVSTLAGTGVSGSANGQNISASFNNPSGVSADVAGNIYVADAGNNLIRKISPSGSVSTLAGSGAAGAVNGALTIASFNLPIGISADIFGNIYVADFNNYLVREIVTTGYTISSGLPAGLTFDGKTGIINGTPTALSPTTIYTVSAYNIGGGNSTQISITVSNVAIPPVGPPNITYSPSVLAYSVNTPITPLVPINTGGILPNKIFGQTTTIAGTGSAGSANGIGTAASFNEPFGVATDVKGNIYVADHLNNLIRKITPDGTVSTLAGSGATGFADGAGAAATFNNPTGVAVDVSGNVYVADVSNNLIRKITPGGVVTTLAGSRLNGSANGMGAAASFSNPSGIAVDVAGNVYVADLSNNLIRKITPGGVVTTLAGSGLSGSADGTGTAASFSQPYGLVTDGTGNVYVADWGNNLIRKITPAGVVTTIAGSGQAGSADGIGAAASFFRPFGITIDQSGNLYVADTNNELIREITPGGLVTTVAGNGMKGATNGVGNQTSFYQPTGIVADGAGDVYVADEFNDLIREIVVVSNYTIDKPLPPGLNFDRTTGIISGTATAVAPPTDYVVTAYNTGGQSSFTINLAVNVLQQAITFGPIPVKTYGDPDFDPGATSNNNTIPLTYTSSNLQVATIVNGEIHITGVGTSTITASQAGDEIYLPANPLSQELTIDPAALTITADDESRVFGIANPVLTVTYSGFVYNDGPAQLTALPVITTTAVRTSPIGQYPITASDAASPDYTITYIPGILTIKPVPTMLVVPSAFTPNGDGINDVWNIKALIDFPQCTVSVYNRYGALVYQSRGYPQPWDGTYNGSPVPTGTYYYIINPQSGMQQLAGPVTILR
jgi:gliding motility-associated-like protein